MRARFGPLSVWSCSPVDVGAVVGVHDHHHPRRTIDLVAHAVVAPTGRVTASELQLKLASHPLRVVRQRAVDELDDTLSVSMG